MAGHSNEIATEAACERVRCEGYGPGGAAVMIDCLTDDRSRTIAEVRHAFVRHGGHLGAEGAVSYLFKPVGVVALPPGTDGAAATERAIAAGAEDVVGREDGAIEVLTDPAQLEAVRSSLAQAGFEPLGAEITERSATSVALAGQSAESMVRLLEALEELDDVQNVYSNAEIPDEVLARLSA